MLRIVTTNNVEVFRHLGTAPFRRHGIAHDVATTADEALALIRDRRPHVALIDADLPGGEGYRLCRAVKDDPALREVRVMLVISSVITREQIEAIRACGCDDVIAVPIHVDDFYFHVAQAAGLPVRRHQRVDVSMEITLAMGGEPLLGTVLNLSTGGAGVRLQGVLARGQKVTCRLVHGRDVLHRTEAKVAWTSAAKDGFQEVGLAWIEPPIEVRLWLEHLSMYQIAPNADGSVTVVLQGDLTERSDLGLLEKRLQDAPRIEFDAAHVRYISSAGVRTWCKFLASLKGKPYTFRHCSMAFALQAAMVPLVIGDGRVLSLEAPYRCDACDRDELRLLETGALLIEDQHVVPPRLNCNGCGGDLAFDDVPDRYFAFLLEKE